MKTKTKCNFLICHKILVHSIIVIPVQYQPASSSYVQLHICKNEPWIRLLNIHYSGMFTAPTDGVYVFSWTIFSYCNSYVYTQIVVNSNAYDSMITESEHVTDVNWLLSAWIAVV